MRLIWAVILFLSVSVFSEESFGIKGFHVLAGPAIGLFEGGGHIGGSLEFPIFALGFSAWSMQGEGWGTKSSTSAATSLLKVKYSNPYLWLSLGVGGGYGSHTSHKSKGGWFNHSDEYELPEHAGGFGLAYGAEAAIKYHYFGVGIGADAVHAGNAGVLVAFKLGVYMGFTIFE